MPSTIPASTACDSTSPAAVASTTFAKTCQQIIDQQIPNLLRLYLNPYVTQCTYCLSSYVEATWPAEAEEQERQVFIANSLDEALSGAIKLARYDANAIGRPPAGIILDESGRLDHFANTGFSDGAQITYLPDVEVFRDRDAAIQHLAANPNSVSFLVAFSASWGSLEGQFTRWLQSGDASGSRPLLILSVSQDELIDRQPEGRTPLVVPDIVVFDESFVKREVPFAAFAATKQLYRRWNQRGMATFHSTTYQPNTISSLQFMNCLREADPAFVAQHAPTLERIENDFDFRLELFGRLYSKSLVKLITTVGFNQEKLRVHGHFIDDDGCQIFDGVAGVACSIRGHNPNDYLEGINACDDFESIKDEVTNRLETLTGLPNAAPAVSGASAVEQALKLGLASQSPREYVLALRGGFGGKTLFALTGTWKPTLKAGLSPLYPNVIFIDPFAADAVESIDQAFARYPIGVVQCELIQGVGGVRAIPDQILDRLTALREQHDCLLFVDEVQTGVYRTGPFVRSSELGLQPDLLTIGKSVSNMMFPFAMTLYNERIRQRLEERGCDLPESLSTRNTYEYGYRTLLNTLRHADRACLEQSVRERGSLFAERVKAELGDCAAVVDVRTFGLLIGIELRQSRFGWNWLNKLLPKLYLLGMLRHREFPLLMGFCQYEPHVLKFTPPLSVTEEEVHRVCKTLRAVLSKSPLRVGLESYFRS